MSVKNGEYSAEGIIQYRIPQGSILGPPFFCIFINNLPLHITGDAVNCEMFANDTSLNASDINTATIRNELQEIITEVSDCCDKNALILHPAETKSMLFACLSLILVSKTITQSKLMSTDILALTSTINFVGDPTLLAHAKQYIYIYKKKCTCLSQLKHFVDTSKQKLSYHAHISPHLTYASTVWDGCSDILYQKLTSS